VAARVPEDTGRDRGCECDAEDEGRGARIGHGETIRAALFQLAAQGSNLRPRYRPQRSSADRHSGACPTRRSPRARSDEEPALDREALVSSGL
jgi:hypothetical protein